MKKMYVLLMLAAITATGLAAQSKKQVIKSSPLVLGIADTLASAVLNEQRAINIYLPDGYSPDSAATYPVIYLLDGGKDEDFIHMAGLVQFESFPWVNRLQPSIVVGIANTDRRRDMTYKAKAGYKLPADFAAYEKSFANAGGSDKFMAFIENELQPYIEKKYKTNKQRTLIGQSLAGLFVAEVLLKKPGLFDNYIVISPSLWWDDESLLKNSTAQLQQQNKPLNIYIAVGKEGKMMEEPARRLAKLLRTTGKQNITVYFDYLAEEDHGTILHTAADRAFRRFSEKKKTR
jgi:predicted alpha/beta superfamily hydrolase